MEVGIIFYDKVTGQFGETLFLDGKVMVGKFYSYNPKKFSLEKMGYGVVTENNKIFGKKHIIDYFDKMIVDLNSKIGTNDYSKEEIMKHVSDKINKATRKITEAGIEIENISKKQMISYSESRERQVKCIQKSIRRNVKRINRYQNSTRLVDNNIKRLKSKIEMYRTYSCVVKGL